MSELKDLKLLSKKKKLGFSFGYLGIVLANWTFATYIFFFYASVIGLDPILIGLALGILGIWDMVNDPIMGHLSDKTKTRWGRRRPYLIFGTIPLIISFIMLWWNPFTEQIMIFFYFLTIMIIFEWTYTMISLSYGALYPELTPYIKERLEIASYSEFFDLIALILGYVLSLIIVGILIGLGYTAATSWLLMSVIMALIMLISIYTATIVTKEQKIFYEAQALRLSEALKYTWKNKAFRIVVLAWLCISIAYILGSATAIFFTTYILGMNELESAISLLFIFLTAIPCLYVWYKLSQKYGTVRSTMGAMILFGFAFILLLFVIDVLIFVVAIAILGIGMAGVILLPQTLYADVIDEDELITGVRREGMFQGIRTFIVKASVSISYVTMAVVLELSGFQSGASVQSKSALQGIRLLISIIPAGFMFLGIIIYIRYPLKGDRLKEVKNKVIKLHEEKRRTFEKMEE
ncbi:MAG: MFS transporter [Candidatus Lokiarchaeota archaeon]|nr:MFS transporter [Candidatus Lokiarchaeota archaeon]MBD3341140.1 MFS transporter [Candidatus Lokiarchaeota archaeon]